MGRHLVCILGLCLALVPAQGQTLRVIANQNTLFHDFSETVSPKAKVSISEFLQASKQATGIACYFAVYGDLNSKQISTFADNTILFQHGIVDTEAMLVVVNLADTFATAVAGARTAPYLPKDLRGNILAQYLLENMRGGRFVPAVCETADVLADYAIRNKGSKAEADRRALIDRYPVSAELWFALLACALPVLWFAFFWVGQYNASNGKMYEATSLYVNERFGKWYFYALVGLVLVAGVFCMFQNVFFYDELFWAIVAMFVAAVPISTALGYVVLGGYDYARNGWAPWREGKNGRLSLAAQYLLAYPSASGEHLLALTYHHLLFTGQIALAYEWRQRSEGEKGQGVSYVVAGPHYDLEGAKPHERLLLAPLENMRDDEGYMAMHYANRINNTLKGPKVLRRDMVGRELAEHGLLGKWSWLLFFTSPNAEGKALGQRTREAGYAAARALDSLATGSGEADDRLALEKIPEVVLFSPNLGAQLDALHQRMAEASQTVPDGLPITPFLHDYFDYNQFERCFENVNSEPEFSTIDDSW